MERKPEDCPTRNGWVLINDQWVKSRETEGGICPTCGKDYFAEEKPNADR